ncbi:MAG: hypothetical protein OSB66_07980 [SAR202 cluster bacterium]|jgi:hypothetical protein|nr:hypothetical protein [SAR202 cluster bacterium]
MFKTPEDRLSEIQLYELVAEKLELPDIAEKAETFTVLVGCWE